MKEAETAPVPTVKSTGKRLGRHNRKDFLSGLPKVGDGSKSQQARGGWRGGALFSESYRNQNHTVFTLHRWM